MNKKQIFKDAWELAGWGAKQYGGSPKEYFSESLKLVYDELAKQKMLQADQERYNAINKLESLLKNDPNSNKVKVARAIHAMRNDSSWKIEKINELIDMSLTKMAA